MKTITLKFENFEIHKIHFANEKLKVSEHLIMLSDKNSSQLIRKENHKDE